MLREKYMSKYYEVELLTLGKTPEGHLSADEESWIEPNPTYWNIFCTKRDNNDDEIHEILDLDIPIKFSKLAESTFTHIQHMVNVANYTKVDLEDFL